MDCNSDGHQCLLGFHATGMHCLMMGACHKLLAGCKFEVWEAWNGQQRNLGTVMMRVGVEEVKQEFLGVQWGYRTTV